MQEIVAHKYYVYSYGYPEGMPLAGTLFYIGKGSGNRMYAHLNQAKQGVRTAKCAAIRKIWEAGLEPVIIRRGEFDKESDALEFESFLIQKYKSDLTNRERMRQKQSPKRANLTLLGKLIYELSDLLDVSHLRLSEISGMPQCTLSKITRRGTGTYHPTYHSVIRVIHGLKIAASERGIQWDEQWGAALLNAAGIVTFAQANTARTVFKNLVEDNAQKERLSHKNLYLFPIAGDLQKDTA